MHTCYICRTQVDNDKLDECVDCHRDIELDSELWIEEKEAA